MSKPYGMYFSDVSGVGPELYDTETDRDVGYLYPHPEADRIARQWALAPVLMAAAAALLEKTIRNADEYPDEWGAVMDALKAMDYQP